jgi:hypothetical protein
VAEMRFLKRTEDIRNKNIGENLNIHTLKGKLTTA